MQNTQIEKRIESYDLLFDATQELKSMILNPPFNFLKIFGELLDKTWSAKKKLEDSISTSEIDAMYLQLKMIGSYGGKLSGAGGGGFLYALIEEKYHQKVLKIFGQARVLKIAYEPFGSRLLSEVY
jgi:galactokinase/mevalonate kinase-like predicted kinase